MDQRRWDEIQAEFDALVELGPAVRAPRLEALGATDPALRTAVEALLAADAEAEVRLAPLEAILSPARAADPLGLSGRTIAHFRIVEPLGAGGMGMVYRAEDTHLSRPVALKFLLPHLTLDPAAKERFLREARAAAALDHPNLCAIHEVGESADGLPFLAMPLYPGQTLKDRLVAEAPLPIPVAMDIARQIALGLGCAHGAGIVHRDLKPGNVMLLPDGTAKILDFGLARTRDESQSGDSASWGTVGYMAPEQVRGETVDARTDLWALGVVLYEMVTGRRPFEDGHALALTRAILEEEPDPPTTLRGDLPARLEDLILTLLEKDSSRRCGNAGAVVAALASSSGTGLLRGGRRTRGVSTLLRRLRLGHKQSAVLAVVLVLAGTGSRWLFRSLRTHHTRIRALAVLPLANLTGDPGQEYFVEAMHDALIGALGELRAVTVTGRTSVLRYRNTQRAIPEIAGELHVDAVVEGSVFRAGDSVRLQVRLITARPESLLWTRPYQADIHSVLALQKEVARDVADQIRIPLTTDERARVADARPVDPAAYDAWARGYFQYTRRTSASLQQCLEDAHTATTIDSTYAAAYALSAMCYNVVTYLSDSAPQHAFPKAKAAALRALALDETLADARFALAWALAANDWDWVGAERAFRRGIESSPSSVQGHTSYAFFLSLMGRHDEALAEARRGESLDPASVRAAQQVAMTLYLARRYDEAIRQARKVVEMDPGFVFGYDRLGHAYAAEGAYDSAIAAFQGAVRASPDHRRKAFLAHAYALAGRTREAQEILRELLESEHRTYVPPTAIAIIYVGLNQSKLALDWLERGYAGRDGDMVVLKTWPVWDPLRGDPRFQGLLGRMQFPERR